MDQKNLKDQLCVDLELNHLLDRNVSDLSGGELQRFAIAVAAMCDQVAYIFDEPSSYLDMKQRFKAAQVIRSLVAANREGIKIFLDGFVPTENLRFREDPLTFKVAETPQESAVETQIAGYRYPTMSKILGGFKLRVIEGIFTDSQIIVVLGENGTGKTTFIRLLAGLLKPDVIEGSDVEVPKFNISYKPQKLVPKSPSTVRDLIQKLIGDYDLDSQFISDVIKPLQIEQLMEKKVKSLCGGELQRVA
ncbi:hypothetical protein Scep_025608 [Stephania cephalantha]|uniref:ABC transporter domain-containing protein n=1 Tax=Stephania cephalantha TaxID=152367 RepID=A0AAP0HPI4_9MAGN